MVEGQCKPSVEEDEPQDGSGTTMLDIPPEELETPPDAAVESESGKFRQLLGILRKAINVKDLASVRISLPANLLEPLGNLEYWTYCDRPDYFASMAEPDDPLERMIAVLRWTFTKDLKFVKHKIAKPYNSILGEHFHCYYDVEPLELHPEEKTPQPHCYLDDNPSPEVMVAAGRSNKSGPKNLNAQDSLPPAASTVYASTAKSESSATTASTLASAAGPASTPGTSLNNDVPRTRVVFLNEQTSHHPPISLFMLEARGPKGIVQAYGADQLSAKFTGTTVKVSPGPRNHGIFVKMPDRGEEEYQITHPSAVIAGLLRGSPFVTISESCYVTCRGGATLSTKLKAIITYQEESWLLKSKFLLDGVIYEYEEGDEDTYTKIKQVPVNKVVAQLEGCWRGEVRWKRKDEKTMRTLVDLVPLAVVPKTVAPLEKQHGLETRKVWSNVTDALLAKDWTTASKHKQTLEQAQRVKAEERKKTGEVYSPIYFELDSGEGWNGRPVLTEAGKQALERDFKAQYDNLV